jgi:hypothetical protein
MVALPPAARVCHSYRPQKPYPPLRTASAYRLAAESPDETHGAAVFSSVQKGIHNGAADALSRKPFDADTLMATTVLRPI